MPAPGGGGGGLDVGMGLLLSMNKMELVYSVYTTVSSNCESIQTITTHKNVDYQLDLSCKPFFVHNYGHSFCAQRKRWGKAPYLEVEGMVIGLIFAVCGNWQFCLFGIHFRIRLKVFFVNTPRNQERKRNQMKCLHLSVLSLC